MGKARSETWELQRVERELLLPLPPDEAWLCLAEPDRLGAWLGGELEVDLRPGGELVLRTEEGERRGFVEDVEEPARVSFWWRAEDDEPATRVELELRERDEGTLLVVRESNPLATLDAVGIELPAPPRGGRPGGTTALALA